MAPWLSILMTMASISSTDSGALPSSSTSGSSDHPPNPNRQHRDWKITDQNGGNSNLLYPTLLHLVSAFV